MAIRDRLGSPDSLDPSREEILRRLAQRYMWRWPIEKSLARVPDVIAQVMNIGRWDDTQALIEIFGENALREVLQHAQPGWFSARSWPYWHYRLELIPPTQSPPPLPKRTYGP